MAVEDEEVMKANSLILADFVVQSHVYTCAGLGREDGT